MNLHRIPRRTFFRGVTLGAGAIYLSPLLRDLQAAEKGSKPARVLFFVQGNGVRGYAGMYAAAFMRLRKEVQQDPILY